MYTVWYCGSRSADGRRHVVRSEWDGESLMIGALRAQPVEQVTYDWGRGSLGCAPLAAELLHDATELLMAQLANVWPAFQREVVERLPLDGWELTQESIIDWWLGGVSTTLSADVYDAVCDGRRV
jgi:hypothetical protein